MAALASVGPAFLATRLLIVLAGVCAMAWWGIDPASAGRDYQARSSSTAAIDMWLRYDASWYLAIATQGYTDPVPVAADMRPAFFPMYPALVATLASVTRDAVSAGLIVSNLACLVLLTALWLLVAEDLGEAIATRAVWIVALFPTSFFLSGLYTESTMIASVTVALFAARRRVWWLAALAAAMATWSRTIGFLLLLPLLGDTWRGTRSARAFIGPAVALTTAVAGAVTVYLGLAAHWFGNPLHFVEVQQWYRGETTWPWQAFVAWSHDPIWHGYANSTMDAVVSLGAIALAIVAALRWNLSYGLYALAVVIVPLTTGLTSLSRLVLPAFPCLVALALLLERRPVRGAWWVLSSLWLAALVARFATWRWVA
jgi:hypothetical protein